MTTQVVTSAGRRFIVSPVPESRLEEQFFSAVQLPAPIFEQPVACKLNFFFSSFVIVHESSKLFTDGLMVLVT